VTRFVEKNDSISRRYHVSMTPAHTLVTQACLGILLHLGENVTRDGLNNFPLADYAAEHWVEHARFEGVLENAEEGMKQLFDSRKSHLSIWVWIFDQLRDFYRTRRPYYRRRKWIEDEEAEQPLPLPSERHDVLDNKLEESLVNPTLKPGVGENV